jgi:hypothetical protein
MPARAKSRMTFKFTASVRSREYTAKVARPARQDLPRCSASRSPSRRRRLRTSRRPAGGSCPRTRLSRPQPRARRRTPIRIRCPSPPHRARLRITRRKLLPIRRRPRPSRRKPRPIRRRPRPSRRKPRPDQQERLPSRRARPRPSPRTKQIRERLPRSGSKESSIPRRTCRARSLKGPSPKATRNPGNPPQAALRHSFARRSLAPRPTPNRPQARQQQDGIRTRRRRRLATPAGPSHPWHGRRWKPRRAMEPQCPPSARATLRAQCDSTISPRMLPSRRPQRSHNTCLAFRCLRTRPRSDPRAQSSQRPPGARKNTSPWHLVLSLPTTTAPQQTHKARLAFHVSPKR